MLSRGAALQRGGRRLVRRDARQRPRRADQDAPSERRWSMLTFRLTPGAVRCCGTAQLHRPRTSTSSRCCRRATPTRPTRPTSGGSAPRAAAASGGCSSIGSRRAGGSPLEARLAAGGARPRDAPLQLRRRAAERRRLPGRDGARALRRREQGGVRARPARRAPLVAMRRVPLRCERGTPLPQHPPSARAPRHGRPHIRFSLLVALHCQLSLAAPSSCFHLREFTLVVTRTTIQSIIKP
mmetsp:Transcript_40750/g.93546  ORF Transcript_40750/g.93546 Transcript_40750/m.93546 type:complete len:239 (+) Transcript_40750:100-816(+)